MYEERQGLSFREIIIQVVLVILFVLIMIWIFPSKGYLENTYVSNEDIAGNISDALDEKLEALYGRLFADNMESMKIAAKDYFTNERLPQEYDETVKITLEEMYEEKLLLELRDSNNESCNVTKSYVEVTKYENEYKMKIQLTCSDYADYIYVYMGCYDYCDTDICEAEKPSVETEKDPEPTPTPTPDPDPEDPKPEPVYEYKYYMREEWANEWSDYGDWSEWSTTYVAADNNTKVEKKTETITKPGDQIWQVVGTEAYQTTSSYNASYTTNNSSYPATSNSNNSSYNATYNSNSSSYNATYNSNSTSYNATANTSAGYYTDWVYAGYVYSTKTLYDTNTVDYTYISQKTTLDCENICETVTTYTYSKKTRTYISGKTTYSCPSGGTLSGTKCIVSGTGTYTCPNGGTLSGTKCIVSGTGTYTCPNGGTLSGTKCIVSGTTTYTCPNGGTLSGTTCVVSGGNSYYCPNGGTLSGNKCTVTNTSYRDVYDWVAGPSTTETITYYRYSTRTLIKEAGFKEETKWSYYNDSSLINQGFHMTGESRVK